MCADPTLQGMHLLQPRLAAGLQAGAERSLWFVGTEIFLLYMSSSSPGLDFRDNDLNFDCITHMNMQVFGSLTVTSISGAGSCRNTAKGSLNTWLMCVCVR